MTRRLPLTDPTRNPAPSPQVYLTHGPASSGHRAEKLPRGASHAERVEFWISRCTVDENGCWIWPGAKGMGGYGHVTLYSPVGARRSTGLHRVVYEHRVGPIPDGLDLDHVHERGCRSRACCNPAHLEPVTTRVNLLRGDTFIARNAAKTHCVHGHAFTPENTRTNKKGGRICVACVARRNRARYSEEIPCPTC